MRLRCEKMCVFQKCAGSRPGTSGRQWNLTAVHAGHKYLIPRLSFSTVHFDWTTSPSAMVWLGRIEGGMIFGWDDGRMGFRGGSFEVLDVAG